MIRNIIDSLDLIILAAVGATRDMKRTRASISNIIVLVAAAIVALAISFGLHIDAGLGIAPSFLSGAAIFFVLVLVHGMVRRTASVLVLEPRIWNLEATLNHLSRNIDEISEFSVKCGQLEGLADDIEAMQIQLHDLTQSEHYAPGEEAIEKLSEQVQKLERGFERFKSQFHQHNKEQKTRVDSELRMVQTLIKQLTEQMASNKAEDEKFESHVALLKQEEQVAPGATDISDSDLAAEMQLQKDSSELFDRLSHGQFDAEMIDIVRQSIEKKRIDLYLQPIVTLPKRKVRYYEALTRIKDQDGAIILPERYIHLAERAGMMPLIDNVMLFRSVQVIRRLTDGSSPRGVFCNISMHSLLDSEFFPEFVAFMEQNRELSEHLYFEFSQEMVSNADSLELGSMNVLSDLGFKFSMDRVSNLDLDFQGLHQQGFHYLKIDANLFLNGMEGAGASIHAADMSDYLKRFGIELIVEKIEDERSCKILQDYDVRLGQGFLFSEPRPVRPEIFGASKGSQAA